MTAELPPELWHLIAAHPSHVSDTSHRSPEDPWNGFGEIKPIRITNFRLSTLVLVCKQWRNLFTPLLYEAAAVRGPQVSALLDMLIPSEPRFDLCQHIRRLYTGLTGDPQLHSRHMRLFTSVSQLLIFQEEFFTFYMQYL